MAKEYFPGKHLLRGSLKDITSWVVDEIWTIFDVKANEELNKIFQEVTGREYKTDESEYPPFEQWHEKHYEEAFDKLYDDLNDVEFLVPNSSEYSAEDDVAQSIIARVKDMAKEYEFDPEWKKKIEDELDFYVKLMSRKEQAEWLRGTPDLFD